MEFVLEIPVDLKNECLERHIADMLTCTLKLEQLDDKSRKTAEELLKELERNELIIVGGLFGSLIVYMLCLSLNAVDELETMYKTGYLETTLNTLVPNATVRIDEREFDRGRKFFKKQSRIQKLMMIQKLRSSPSSIGGKLNDMPSVLLHRILKQTLWTMWVCYLFESLQPRSPVSMEEYLKDGIQGFSKFVKDASTCIYKKISPVCIVWRNLLKMQRKSLKLELLSHISRTVIRMSFNILIENIQIIDDLLQLSLDEKLITVNEKEYCESSTSSEKLTRNSYYAFSIKTKE